MSKSFKCDKTTKKINWQKMARLGYVISSENYYKPKIVDNLDIDIGLKNKLTEEKLLI